MPVNALDALAPSSDWGYVTISDVADSATGWRYLLIATAGTLKVTTAAGTVLTTPSLPAGTYIMGGVRRVWATGGTLNAAAATTVLGFP